MIINKHSSLNICLIADVSVAGFPRPNQNKFSISRDGILFFNKELLKNSFIAYQLDDKSK